MYSLTSLPPNMSVIPSNWSAGNLNHTDNPQRNEGNNQSVSEAGDGLKGEKEHTHHDNEDSDDDMDAEMAGRGSSVSLRESITSRHSLVISADQGANTLTL